MKVESIIENPPFKLNEDDINALLGRFGEFEPYDWAQLKNIIGISRPTYGSQASSLHRTKPY